MANETRRPPRALEGYDGHLGTDWPESARWVYQLDAEHMTRFRAELGRLLPDRPDVVELLCREPRDREEWVKELSPEERAWLESIPEADDDEFPPDTVEVIFIRNESNHAVEDEEPKDSGSRPDWYYRLDEGGKREYDAWVAEGAPSWMDEDESGVTPAKLKKAPK